MPAVPAQRRWHDGMTVVAENIAETACVRRSMKHRVFAEYITVNRAVLIEMLQTVTTQPHSVPNGF